MKHVGAAYVRRARLALSRKKPRPDLAWELLERAHAKGNAEAAYALGTWYMHGTHVRQNLRKAIALLRQGAAGKHAHALFDLAICYEKGVGVRANPAKALALYIDAALHGHRQSAYESGRC